MGEIDRISPILRPVLGPRSADRVNPDAQHHREHHEDRDDKLELSNDNPDIEQPQVVEEKAAAPEQHLDLSI
jgi:hypothetical protein